MATQLKPKHTFQAVLPAKIAEQSIPEKVSEALRATPWDALVVLGVENVQYCSGTYLPNARQYLDRQNIVVWPRDDEPTYIGGAEMISGIKQRTKYIKRFVGYEEKGALPPAVIVDTVADVLREYKLEKALIGLEMLRTSVVFWERLRELLTQARFESADAMLRRLRMVKTLEEIETIATAATCTDDAIWRAFLASKPGDTEYQVAQRILTYCLDNGCTSVPVIYFGSGEGVRVIGYPSERRLTAGDFVRLDINTMYGGYYCDMGRMAFVGKPRESQIEAYRQQIELKRGILEYMRPGRTCADVHAFYLEEASRMNVKLFVYPYLGVGHATGVNNDEFPKLNYGEQTVLEPGMIFDVEPDTVGPEGEIMHSEDMVLVTNNGIEVITTSEGHDWSQLLLIPA